MMSHTVDADACVVGGGPAGLGFALSCARLGRKVIVVEKSLDFERSFRGESILPDSVWLLKTLGLLDSLLEQQVQYGRELEITDHGHRVLHIDFEQFDQPERFPLEIPQPMLLATMTEAAEAHEGFTLMRGARVTGLTHAGDRVTGVTCKTSEADVTVQAPITLGADGRYSQIRELAGIEYHKQPLQRDVLWFKLPYPSCWKPNVYRFRMEQDRNAVFLPTHPDMVRVGVNIPKGGLRAMRSSGIEGLYARMNELAPELEQSMRQHVLDWSSTLMLDIFTTTVPRWSVPGLILVGDAAHTLSPILGHGVNHAIMDALTLAPMIDTALAQPGATAALDAVGDQFQRVREGKVAAARSLQLRQERVFALSSPWSTRLRRATYATVNRIGPVKTRILSRAYYTIPQTDRPLEVTSR